MKKLKNKFNAIYEKIKELNSNGSIIILFVTVIELLAFTLLLPLILFLYLVKITTNFLKYVFNRSKSNEIKHIKKNMKDSKNYEEWFNYATKLDELEGREKWKNEKESNLYDYNLIKERIKELKLALETNDPKIVMKCVQIGLKRNIGGICNPDLHRYCYIGTKKLIEEYYDLVCSCLDFVLEADRNLMNNEKKFEKFKRLRQSFGGTAIMLSGGAALGQVHVGVITALIECDILPTIISGSSVGSVIASIVCTSKDEEIMETLKKLEEGKINLDVFANDSVKNRLYRLITKGFLMDVKKLKSFLQQLIPPDLTFKSAYEKTGRILNISISNEYEGTLVLNYITAPSVYIWSAVLCSCSAPFLYDRVNLKMKGIKQKINLFKSISNTKWSDGSLSADLPQERMRELFNINHFIVSQVNPYITPFLPQNSVFSEVSTFSIFFEKLKYFFRTEITHRVNQLAEFKYIGNTFKKIQRIVNQNYIGDINIYPSFSFYDYSKVISNPTLTSLKRFANLGMKSTFSKISHILTATKIERKLDQCIEDSFKKIHLGEDKVNFKVLGHSPSFHSKRNGSLPILNPVNKLLKRPDLY